MVFFLLSTIYIYFFSLEYVYKVRIQMKLFNLICIFLTIICSSCTTEVGMKAVENIDIKKLKGTWEVDCAFRNDVLTQTLDKLYFNFEENELHHNLGGKHQTAFFKLRGCKLHVDDTQYPAVYDTKLINDSILELHTMIRNSNFNIVFKKAL